MELMIDYAGREGLDRIEGQILSENTTMLRMCGELGFHLEHDRDDPSVTVATLSLRA